MSTDEFECGTVMYSMGFLLNSVNITSNLGWTGSFDEEETWGLCPDFLKPMDDGCGEQYQGVGKLEMN